MKVGGFLLKSSAVIALAVGSAAAMAVALTPPFTFDPGVGYRGTLGAFQANNISACPRRASGSGAARRCSASAIPSSASDGADVNPPRRRTWRVFQLTWALPRSPGLRR